MGKFSIKIPSTELVPVMKTPVQKIVLNRWRDAKHIRTNKQVSALELSAEQALLATRLLNVSWVSAGDYLVSYRDGSVRPFKKANFDDTYYFMEEE